MKSPQKMNRKADNGKSETNIDQSNAMHLLLPSPVDRVLYVE